TRDRRQVAGGGVSLVSVEAIPRILIMQSPHVPIAPHLRNNRRRRDSRTPAVAVRHAPLGHWQSWNAEGVDEDDVWERDEGKDRPLHGLERGLVDVDPVD